MHKPLEGIRVLDLTSRLCGPFCTQILHDLGAEVIKLAPPGSFDCREESAAYYVSLNRGKKHVSPDWEKKDFREYIFRLVETSNVFVEDLGPGKSDNLGIGYEAVRQWREDIIYLSITGYGHEGIYRDYSSQDAIVQALSGFMSITGEAGGRYTKSGIPLADMFTAVYGAIGVLAGLIFCCKTGESLYIDLAKLDVMISAMPDVFAKYLNTGQTTRPKGCRHQLVGYFGPVRTKDGTVICMAAQDHQFKALVEILGLDGLEKDTRFDTMAKRCQNIEELEPVICSRAKDMTMDELMEKLLQRKVPAGPVYTLERILDSDYVSFHKLIKKVFDSAGSTFLTVGFPVKFSQFEEPQDDFVSLFGEFTQEVENSLPPLQQTRRAMRCTNKRNSQERPLSGIRVLDLTRFMAGPLGTEILDNLGAEVIKVERRSQRSEFSRSTEPTFGKTSAYFISINSGKKDISLDLEKEEQRKILLKLAERCDVMADNFRPGVTKKLGISYENVKKRRPDIIYSTVSGFGYTGPYRTRGCVDTVCQAMSGFMSLMGEEGGEIIRAGSSVADVCAALYETVAILASLIWHQRTGQGGMADTPMLSAMVSILDGMAAEYLNNGIKLRGTGNRDRSGALAEAVPASDGEVMVEAKTEEHFSALVKLLNRPDLLEDPRYSNSENRLKHIESLESAIFKETRKMTKAELAGKCRKVGIPAGEVNTVESICRSGYLEQRRMVVQVEDSKEGRFRVLGLPLKFDRFSIPQEKTVSQPGEHTEEILKSMLGMDEEAIRELLTEQT